MNATSNLAKFNHRRSRLDDYYKQAETIILTRQDPVTGLLPASTAVTVHGDYTHAWVRDNVYSILAVWGLTLAYRQEDHDRSSRLEQAVVKLMRGLLAAMMQQAGKVERFKHTQDPLDALHAKYDTHTGEPVVGDDAWGHLQLDATAIFLLMLVQMSKSGLGIVQNPHEVDFIQNLVYYLAKANRTPDYGIWERGHKHNEGVAEINASSVGMAKAALEAVQGFDPLPGKAPAIHVQGDDIAQARNTLEGLLPRESESKETDASLLSVIGFPAYAVEDPILVGRTRAEIVDKLQGRYGCKRFLRDGHQTVLEDHSRLHYEPGELREFENIESEWPLFFTYFLLDAALRGDEEEARDYRARLEDLFQERDGQHLLPELYYVPADLVELERARPHSQSRLPNENVPLVWAQSLYLLGALLQEGYIQPADIDPLERHLRIGRPREATVQVALLAEDDVVQARLASQCVMAETLQEIAPVQVHYADELEAALGELGSNTSLGLSGRPLNRLGSLATSQLFTLGDESLLFLPHCLNRNEFYVTLDNRLLADTIKGEITYLRRHWYQAGRPLLALLITGPMLDAAGADVLLTYLKELQEGEVDGVLVDRLPALLHEAGRDRVDWLERFPIKVRGFEAGAEVEAVLTWEEGSTRPLTLARAAALEREPDNQALLRQLAKSRNPYEQTEILGLLRDRLGGEFATESGGNVRELIEAIYMRACQTRSWGVMRRAAGLLQIHDETLEEAVAQIVERQKRVAVGRDHTVESVIAKPLRNAEIILRLHAHSGDDPRARVLIEEIVLFLGMLIKAEPELFKGTITLRAWHLLLLISGRLAREHGVTQAEAFDHLLDLSPHAILGRLREVIASEKEMMSNMARLQSLHFAAGNDTVVQVTFMPGNDPTLPEGESGWLGWREMTGVITRLPEDFYVRIWDILHHCRGLVIGDQLDSRNRLDSALAQADMTPAEQSFALRVEDLLNKIQAPEYRQLTIEALLVLSETARANPDLKIDGYLVVDVVISAAVRLAWGQTPPNGEDLEYGEHLADAWNMFYASPPHRVANYIMAAVTFLLEDAAEETSAA
jgi:phosphorylase kinase alpha/beta subunit